MRAVVQRVTTAHVTVAGNVVAKIGPGLVVLAGVSVRDSEREAAWLAEKVCGLRVFRDEDQNMNRSVMETRGEVLAVSQFTLYGDARRGRRPSYIDAAAGEKAEPIYRAFCDALRALGVPVAEGIFGAMMDVSLINDGPVTILLDSDRAF